LGEPATSHLPASSIFFLRTSQHQQPATSQTNRTNLAFQEKILHAPSTQHWTFAKKNNVVSSVHLFAGVFPCANRRRRTYNVFLSRKRSARNQVLIIFSNYMPIINNRGKVHKC